MIRSLVNRESTYASGHFGPISNQVDFSNIHPSPGKKSVLYNKSKKKIHIQTIDRKIYSIHWQGKVLNSSTIHTK